MAYADYTHRRKWAKRNEPGKLWIWYPKTGEWHEVGGKVDRAYYQSQGFCTLYIHNGEGKHNPKVMDSVPSVQDINVKPKEDDGLWQ